MNSEVVSLAVLWPEFTVRAQSECADVCERCGAPSLRAHHVALEPGARIPSRCYAFRATAGKSWWLVLSLRAVSEIESVGVRMSEAGLIEVKPLSRREWGAVRPVRNVPILPRCGSCEFSDELSAGGDAFVRASEWGRVSRALDAGLPIWLGGAASVHLAGDAAKFDAVARKLGFLTVRRITLRLAESE